jgi:hypothetical protein
MGFGHVVITIIINVTNTLPLLCGRVPNQIVVLVNITLARTKTHIIGITGATVAVILMAIIAGACVAPPPNLSIWPYIGNALRLVIHAMVHIPQNKVV